MKQKKRSKSKSKAKQRMKSRIKAHLKKLTQVHGDFDHEVLDKNPLDMVSSMYNLSLQYPCSKIKTQFHTPGSRRSPR